MQTRQSRLTRTRLVALFTGGLLSATAFLPALGLKAAQADTAAERKQKQYKIGALVLGGAAVYMGIKKKNPIAAAAAAAAAYYAYKKSKDAKRAERFGYEDGYNREDDYQGGYNRDEDQYAQYPNDNDGYDPDYRDRRDDSGNEGYASSPGDFFPDYSSRVLTPKNRNRKSVVK